MFKIVRKEDATIRKIAENKTATDYFTKDFSKDVSLTTLEATNYTNEFTPVQNFIYFVLNGELLLKFDDQEVELLQGDACFVTKGTTYIMTGTFQVVVISQPAFGTK